eukprot:COSAG02_NODE_4965_length_4774_cov_8.825455_4_plen_76_part_00
MGDKVQVVTFADRYTQRLLIIKVALDVGHLLRARSQQAYCAAGGLPVDRLWMLSGPRSDQRRTPILECSWKFEKK